MSTVTLKKPIVYWQHFGPVLIFLFEPLAQSVEQLPFKQWVVGSSPTRLTFYVNLEKSKVKSYVLSMRNIISPFTG